MLVAVTSKICIVFILSNVFSIIKAESGYDTLDPWGDVPNPVQHSNPLDDIFENNPVSKKSVVGQSISYDEVLNYYIRLLNLVFKRSAFKADRGNADKFIRNINLQVSQDQFKRIFNPVETLEDLRKIDGVISDIFMSYDEGFSDKIYDILEGWYHSLRVFTQEPFAKVVLLVSIFLCTLIYLKFVSGLSTLKISMMLLIIAAYCWTYYDMYMNAEINRMIELKKYPVPPKECSVESMSFYEKIIYKMTRALSSDPCKDYYMLTSVTTFETVNPAIVAVEMVTRLVTQPLTTASEKLGQGLTALFYSIPMPYSFILFPIALVFFLIILIFFACYALGIHVNFNIFHLVSFSIGSVKSEPPSPIKLEDIALMANALRDAQMHQITNSNLESLERRLLGQCEHILKYKNRENQQKMIEDKISENSCYETANSSKKECKINHSDDVCDIIPKLPITNIENLDSTNSIKENDISSLKKDTDISKNKIRTQKIVNSLMENINDMENRLEKANKSINETLIEIKNAVDNVDH